MPTSRHFRRAGLTWAGGTIAAGAVLLGACASSVTAGTCLEQVRALAHDYDLSVDPPTPAPGAGASPPTSEELARSGGIIAPPPTSDPAVIEPPDDQRYGMPTLPEVPSQPAPTEDQGSGALSATKRASVGSILMAARADAEEGREMDCLRKLQEARKVIGASG